MGKKDKKQTRKPESILPINENTNLIGKKVYKAVLEHTDHRMRFESTHSGGVIRCVACDGQEMVTFEAENDPKGFYLPHVGHFVTCCWSPNEIENYFACEDCYEVFLSVYKEDPS